MASKDQLNSQYINEKVNPLLEKLVIDLLIYKPDNSVFFSFILFNPISQLEFMKEWLNDKGGTFLCLISHLLFYSF